MTRYYDCSVILETPDDTTVEDVTDALVGFADSRGWYCGGGFKEVDEEGNFIAKPDTA